LLIVAPPVYSQSEISVGAIGESYLDGIELATILEIENVPIEAEVLSYLDEIEFELTEFDNEFISTGAVEGYYGTLDDCIAAAIERHMPLKIAQDKIELAKRKLVKSVRDLFPKFTVSYEHNKGFKLIKSDSDPTDGIDDNQQFRSERVRYSVSQPLFRGGALWNQVKVEKAHLRVAKEEFKKVYYDITIEVARAYYNLIKAKTMRNEKHQLHKVVNALVAISEEKQLAGLISEIEHLNVQSQDSQIDHDKQAVNEEVELARIDVKKMLHLDIDAYIDVPLFTSTYADRIQSEIESAPKRPEEDIENAKLDELIKIAYQNRPEFKIQKYKVEAASWAEKVENAGWLPAVNLVAERGRKSEAYKIMDNNPIWDDEHHVGVEVKWNFGGNKHKYVYDKNRQGTGVEATDINVAMDGYYDRRNAATIGVFDGLEQFEKTKDAEIKRKEAQLELELSEKDVLSEVKEAYYAFNRALVQLRSVFKRIVYRKKLVELARHRSEINEIQISEYIQAEIDFVNEKNALYQSMLDYSIAKISLNKAIGIRDYITLDEGY